MLTTHRDRENLVHSHQVPVKQQPKTPGARYPKSPRALGRNDENAPAAFAGKSGMGGATILGGNDKLMAKGTGARQALLTPMDARTRAPLGNKTTNAKARAAQGQGLEVKDMIKEIELTQAKQATVRKAKQRSTELVPRMIVFEAKQDQDSDEKDIEYCPPRPGALLYRSDSLPGRHFTARSLKRTKSVKGAYQQFHNPLEEEDDTPRLETKLDGDITSAWETTVDCKEPEHRELDWNLTDVPVEPMVSHKRSNPTRVASNSGGKRIKTVHQRQPTTIAARRAASALGMSSDAKNVVAQPVTSGAPARKPLGSIIRGRNSNKPATQAQNSFTSGSAGQAASRTTIGYAKGRSASSLLHHRGESMTNRPYRAAKAPSVVSNDESSELTITPARLGQCATNKEAASDGHPRFPLLSAFDQDEDDESIPPIGATYQQSEDEESFVSVHEI